MARTFRGSRSLVTFTALLAVAACDGTDPTMPGPGRLLEDPSSGVALVRTAVLSYAVGDTATITRLSAVGREALANNLTMTWRIGSTTIGTITQQGFFTARAAGKTNIFLAAGKWVDTIAVTVISAPVATVTVTTAAATMTSGQSATATAVARDSKGAIISGATFAWSSSNASVASASSTGVVTAISGGSATIRAASGGVTGTRAITVSSSTSNTSTASSAIALPALPTLLNHKYPTVTGTSWIVRAGDNLQNALNNAKRGDEIVLQAGATFTGNFALPGKVGTAANGWILIRSSASGQLPPQGTRVGTTHASLMPKIVSPNVSPAIRTHPGTSGWWISGVEVTMVPALPSGHIQYGLVVLGATGTAQNTLSQVPNDIVLDRTYIHGQPNVQLIRCVALNSGRSQISDSYLSRCHAKGFDSQAILGWNGPGPFKIVNNMLAGAGENVMFGGGDPAIPNLIPSDVEIRRNYFYTPPAWKGVWTKKNLFETKNVQRMLIEGNVFDGSWQDAQTGFAFVLKVSNQSGSCTWCAVRDLTIRNNLIRNVAGGFAIMGRASATAKPVAEPLNRVLIENNIIQDLNVGIFTGEGRIVSVMNDAQNITIRNNTMTTTGPVKMYLNLATNPAATNFAWERNITTYGTYGFYSQWYNVGENSLKAFRGTVVMQQYTMVGPVKAGYPNGTFASSLSAALSTGVGATATTVQSATQGVAIP